LEFGPEGRRGARNSSTIDRSCENTKKKKNILVPLVLICKLGIHLEINLVPVPKRIVEVDIAFPYFLYNLNSMTMEKNVFVRDQDHEEQDPTSRIPLAETRDPVYFVSPTHRLRVMELLGTLEKDIS
jgi:hypothetical protein